MSNERQLKRFTVTTTTTTLLSGEPGPIGTPLTHAMVVYAVDKAQASRVAEGLMFLPASDLPVEIRLAGELPPTKDVAG